MVVCILYPKSFDYLLTFSRHLMTGLGAYFYITWGIWLRHCLNGRQDEYTLVWPSIFTLPEIVRSVEMVGSHQGKASIKTQ